MTSPSPDSAQPLDKLVRRFRSNPEYMASAIVTYQKQEKLTDAAVARRLGIDEAQLPRLALCKRPRQAEGTFLKDVRQIAAYTGANEFALAQLLRQVEVMESFQSLPQTTTKDDAQTMAVPAVLAAARDQEQPEPPPDTEEKASPDEDEQNHVAR